MPLQNEKNKQHACDRSTFLVGMSRIHLNVSFVKLADLTQIFLSNLMFVSLLVKYGIQSKWLW